MAGVRYPCWLTYNGEVYNFAELRKELEMQGHMFQSRSDSEVVLRAYEAWGLDAIRRFRGMFSFGLWDEGSRRLILARDPLGMKPLYYFLTSEIILFASEVRTLLATGLVQRRMDVDGLTSFLRWGSVEAPLSMIDGVRSLLPGRYLVVKPHQGTLVTEETLYADDLFSNDSVQSTTQRREVRGQLRHLLEESVRLHLVSDVPLGVFLSGGIDSTAITALMRQVGSERPRTFNVAFAEGERSEARYARLVAEKYGTDHQEIDLSEGRLLDLLPTAITGMDQPTIDGINTFVISKAVRDAGVTVALSGLGGDELFAGYPSFHRASRLQVLGAVPRSVRRIAAEAGALILGSSVRQRKFWELIGSEATSAAGYGVSRRLFAYDEISRALGESTLRVKASEDVDSGDVVNSVSRSELRGYMANTLLRDTDCMSMAHGLEVRVPFVDPVVVKYVLGLPGKWKLRRGQPKPLLLDALGELVPREIWQRQKQGFALPFDRWLRSVLAPRLDKMLEDESALTSCGIKPEFPRIVWRLFKKTRWREGWSRPWAFYVLTRWCEVNQVRL